MANLPFVRIYREEDKEFRQYDAFIVATTKETGRYQAATETALERLYSYCRGYNATGVMMPLNAPVFQQKDVDDWVVSLALPPQYDLKTAPAPIDNRVEIKKIAPKKVAVIEYGAHNTAERIKAKERELLHWLGHQKDFAPMSRGRVAQYKSRLGLPFFKHNEVQIDVRIV